MNWRIVTETMRLWLEESNATDDLIAFLQQNSTKICTKVMENPGIGIRALLGELNVSTSTINEDLHHYLHKRRRGQLLAEKAHENRLTKGKKLLSKVKHSAEPQTILFFSDEKNFCQVQKLNTQNNRLPTYTPKDTHRVMHTNFSKTVMVFGCMSCDGDVMPPYFFQRGSQVEL